jgi:hypothetical protein
MRKPTLSAGSTASLTGFGFVSGQKVDVYWDNTQTLLGVTTTNINGSFDGSAAVMFTVPSGASAGTHKVVARGDYPTIVTEASFTVR